MVRFARILLIQPYTMRTLYKPTRKKMRQPKLIHLPGNRPIPSSFYTFTFARSGGPGGQKVNKTSSKVDFCLDLAHIAWIFTEAEYQRVMLFLQSYIVRDSVFHLQCDIHREQSRNLEEVLKRAQELLHKALHKPKRRKQTKPTRGSVQRRLTQKSKRSLLKRSRKDVSSD